MWGSMIFQTFLTIDPFFQMKSYRELLVFKTKLRFLLGSTYNLFFYQVSLCTEWGGGPVLSSHRSLSSFSLLAAARAPLSSLSRCDTSRIWSRTHSHWLGVLARFGHWQPTLSLLTFLVTCGPRWGPWPWDVRAMAAAAEGHRLPFIKAFLYSGPWTDYLIFLNFNPLNRDNNCADLVIRLWRLYVQMQVMQCLAHSKDSFSTKYRTWHRVGTG